MAVLPTPFSAITMQRNAHKHEALAIWEMWLKGIAAAAIAGGANGIITGFAAVGIDPAHFNLQSGLHATLSIAMVSATMSGIIGVAAYLKQSPLPPDSAPPAPPQNS
jgi:hypothetical protein